MVALMLALGLTAIVPSAHATLTQTFGKVLTEPTSTSDISEVRFTAAPSLTVAAAILAADTNNDDVVQTTEGWYIDMDASGAVSIADIRLTNAVSTYQAFSFVKSGETDTGEDLDAAGSLCYSDEWTAHRGTSTYNVQPVGTIVPSTLYTENVYIDISSTTCGSTVAQDDVRITASNSHSSGGSAGARVASGATDIGNATVQFAAAARIRGYDLDNSGGYSLNDGIYLDVDNSGTPNAGDLRLTAWGSLQAGTAVRVGDTDTDGAIEALGVTPQFVFVDSNTDGTFTCASETLYLVADFNSGIDVDDYRINQVTGSASFSAGTIVDEGDADIGSSNTVVADARIKYYDGNGGAAFGIGDTLYMDADNSDTVNAGDLRIGSSDTGLSAVTCVTSSSNDKNLAIATAGLTLRFRFLDQDASGGLSRGDLPYLDSDSNDEISIGDIRLSSVYSTFGTVGTFVDDDSVDRYYAFPTNAAVGTAPVLRYSDANGNGAFGANDPVYVAMGGTTTVRAADVRLSTGAGSCAAGTHVSSADSCSSDFGDPTSALAAAVLRYNEEGTFSGAYDDEDYVYLDTDAGGTVTVGDVRLQSRGGGGAGSFVLGGNDDLSDSLSNFPDGAFDADRIRVLKTVPSTHTGFSTTYSVGDVVIYDTDNDGYPTIGDVILSGQSGATSSSSSGTTNSGSSGSSGSSGTTTDTSPSANFNVQSVDDGALTITVNGAQSTAVSGRTITTYAWDWGDGTSDSGTQSTRSHTYDDAGTYSVRLTVTDSSGKTGTQTRSVIVGEVADTTTDDTADDTADDTSDDATDDDTTDSGDSDDADDEPDDGAGAQQEGTPAVGAVLLVTSLVGLLALGRRRRL